MHKAPEVRICLYIREPPKEIRELGDDAKEKAMLSELSFARSCVSTDDDC
jgi:hypothetical protein